MLVPASRNWRTAQDDASSSVFETTLICDAGNLVIVTEQYPHNCIKEQLIPPETPGNRETQVY